MFRVLKVQFATVKDIDIVSCGDCAKGKFVAAEEVKKKEEPKEVCPVCNKEQKKYFTHEICFGKICRACLEK